MRNALLVLCGQFEDGGREMFEFVGLRSFAKAAATPTMTAYDVNIARIRLFFNARRQVVGIPKCGGREQRAARLRGGLPDRGSWLQAR